MTSLRRNLALAAVVVSVMAVAGLSSAARAEGEPPAGLPVKVYLMAGQSNMVGHASARYIQENHTELTKPRPDVWCVGIGGHITREGQFQAFDELAIWSRPLKAREVKALHNNGCGAEIKLAK